MGKASSTPSPTMLSKTTFASGSRPFSNRWWPNRHSSATCLRLIFLSASPRAPSWSQASNFSRGSLTAGSVTGSRSPEAPFFFRFRLPGGSVVGWVAMGGSISPRDGFRDRPTGRWSSSVGRSLAGVGFFFFSK